MRKPSKARREFLECQLSAIASGLSECEKQSRRIKACLAETEKVSSRPTKTGDNMVKVVINEGVNVELLNCYARAIRNQGDVANLIRRILAGKSVDSYGKCSNCERRIPKKRLKIVPWASMCVPCQEAAKTAE